MFLRTMGAATAVTATSGLPFRQAIAAEPLKIWTIGVAKVGAKPGTSGKDWSDMAAQAGIELAYSAKSGSADQAIQKLVVGDGSKLYDAVTDNGGGMEDALASQKVIVPIDTSRINNWNKLLPHYNKGGKGEGTIRSDGKVYAVPYISNADSLAFNYSEIGQDLNSWDALFDSQFRESFLTRFELLSFENHAGGDLSCAQMKVQLQAIFQNQRRTGQGTEIDQ